MRGDVKTHRVGFDGAGTLKVPNGMRFSPGGDLACTRNGHATRRLLA